MFDALTFSATCLCVSFTFLLYTAISASYLAFSCSYTTILRRYSATSSSYFCSSVRPSIEIDAPVPSGSVVPAVAGAAPDSTLTPSTPTGAADSVCIFRASSGDASECAVVGGNLRTSKSRVGPDVDV